MPPIILVDSLVKRYRAASENAVDGISFEVAAGELYTLLGPNGAGKTTTISILTTTLAPTAGHVMIAGYDLARDAAAVRRSVGIIFQRPSIDLNLTAEENVRLHAVLYGVFPFRPSFRTMPRAYRERVGELAQILGLSDDIFKPIKTFSGGMRRKLEIIRSLIHEPQVLFLDEPTVGLDPSSRRSLWEYLGQTRAAHGTTVFLTTHYLDEAEQSDRVCIINKGRIVALGTPAEVKARLIENYLLLDAADRAALRAELARLELDVSPEAPFKVGLKHYSAQAIIKAIDTPLTLLSIHTPSLEDAYLEIIGAENDL